MIDQLSSYTVWRFVDLQPETLACGPDRSNREDLRVLTAVLRMKGVVEFYPLSHAQGWFGDACDA